MILKKNKKEANVKFDDKSKLSWRDPRNCLFCGVKFTPARPQDAQQKFCQLPHKDAFYKFGSMPFPKLVAALRKAILKDFAADMREEFAGQIRAELEQASKELKIELVRLVRTLYADSGTHDANHDEGNSNPSGEASPDCRGGGETEAGAPIEPNGIDPPGDAEKPEIRGNLGAGVEAGPDAGVPARRKKRAPKGERITRPEIGNTEVRQSQ